MRKVLFAFTTLFTIAACNSIADNPNVEKEDAKKGIESLKKEVMTLHDTAMDKMSTISNLQKKLKEMGQTQVDSLPYQQAYRKLQGASDDMMGWMRSFELPEAEEAQQRTYLLEEKKAVQAVDAEMKDAIAEARHLLKITRAEMEADQQDHQHSEGDHQH
ncbi:MAG: hypothetical protein U5L96_00285 [Owenweeksia sp.]|nr:hypothetical protein [Owenweeksia sp.]